LAGKVRAGLLTLEPPGGQELNTPYGLGVKRDPKSARNSAILPNKHVIDY